ncbi:MAG: hypothetical protein ACI9DF_000014 [Verrucomicrobiales bacterium]|jgi:hypothetical protein
MGLHGYLGVLLPQYYHLSRVYGNFQDWAYDMTVVTNQLDSKISQIQNQRIGEAEK